MHTCRICQIEFEKSGGWLDHMRNRHPEYLKHLEEKAVEAAENIFGQPNTGLQADGAVRCPNCGYSAFYPVCTRCGNPILRTAGKA